MSSWYSYTKNGIHKHLKISVNLDRDAARLTLHGNEIYTGDCDGLLDALAALADEHGHDPDPTPKRHVDGQCVICDGPVAPAIFHTATCHSCGKPKRDVMDALDEDERLIQGQSCVYGHYLCSECYRDERPEATYVVPPTQS